MRVREAREQARITQGEAAEHLGISRPTYIKMEKNPEIIEMGEARKLAELFGVSIDDINFFESDCN